jgi:hypothetical protein
MGETSTRACEITLEQRDRDLKRDRDLRDEVVHDKAANPRGTRKAWQLDVIARKRASSFVLTTRGSVLAAAIPR